MRSIALDQKELLQQLDSLQFGGASGTDDGNELGHVSLAGQGARQASLQLAPKSFWADALGDNVIVIDIIADSPVRQRRNAAPAGDHLPAGAGDVAPASREPRPR